MKTTEELIELLRLGTKHLSSMAKNLDCPWSLENEDPRKLHNVYAKNLITCYVSKFTQLSETILSSRENQNYLSYALAGRSLIEITATLRYYSLNQYKPLLDKGNLTMDDMKRLIEIDDRHLRGNRFDWESFLSKRYKKLIEDATKQIANKKDKQKKMAKGIISEQVNVLTCIEKWAKDTPEVLIAYNLFCDLVHPNIGSSFLVASTSDEGLYFTPSRGRSVGSDIFEQSFPLLLSVTHKRFGEYLFRLIGTIWPEDEL